MARERRPTITVDARALGASGVGRYLAEILQRLVNDTRFSRVRLLGEPARLQAWTAAAGGEVMAEVVPYPGGFYSPRTQLAWLALRARGQPQSDVSFFPYYDAPAVGLPPRSVVTVHDLTQFRVPGAFPAWKRVLAGVHFDRVLSRAARVLVPSQSTRADLVERLPALEPRTQWIAEGVSDCFYPPPAAELAVDARVVSRQPYLLFVGNRKPHKNLQAAVRVLARLRAEWPALRLVVAGRSYAGWSDTLALAAELGVRTAVVEVDAPTDAELRALYAGCEALLFPSLYEGFGLPPLEAMACGAPVVASDRSSIPEVVGDAGLLCAPDDVEAMAAAVRRLRDEPGLRRRMVGRGRKHAATFSWERAARRTLDVLHAVAVGTEAHGPIRPELVLP